MKNRQEGPSPWYETYFGPDYLRIDVQNNTAAEVDFLVAALKLGEDVRLLDVACGYGRHLVPLLGRGVDAWGCDLSAFMLEELSRRQGASGFDGRRAVRCDVRSLPFEGVFDRACYMFNSFGYFERDDDNFRALTSIRDALVPGGLFLLDLVNRDTVIRSMQPRDWFERDGAYILERKRIDIVRNRSEIDVVVIDDTGPRAYHHSIRLFSYTELCMLLEAAGFMVRAVFGGFGGEPFDENHARMLVLSQSAAEV